jgi:hypothetical protein
VAQRIEHLTTDQKVGGSNPSGCAKCDVSGHRWQVSRDIVAFLRLLRPPGVEGGAVLAVVKAGALRVACGQP